MSHLTCYFRDVLLCPRPVPPWQRGSLGPLAGLLGGDLRLGQRVDHHHCGRGEDCTAAGDLTEAVPPDGASHVGQVDKGGVLVHGLGEGLPGDVLGGQQVVGGAHGQVRVAAERVLVVGSL